MQTHRLDRSRAALLVIDVQERLAAAMEPGAFGRLLRRTEAAITCARELGLPIVATEQYPKGLGPTVAPIRQAVGPGWRPVTKTAFGAWVPEVEQQLEGRSQILVAGMETHVCVFQSARQVVDAGKRPIVLMDAVLSRTPEERTLGLSLIHEAGGLVSSVETAFFDLLGDASAPAFKAISRAVK